MPILLGLDAGTTTITALALDAASGKLLAAHTLANNANITSEADRRRGRSEWDAGCMEECALACLRAVADGLGAGVAKCVGLGLTGQQHGVLVLDEELSPLGPFIGWQDRRALEPRQGGTRTVLDEAHARLGLEAPGRAGCRLAAGYMGATLFWMKLHDLLPAKGTVCFLGDYLGSLLTGQPPVSEPTCAASSGLLDLDTRTWDLVSLAELGLSPCLFPPVSEAGTRLGALTPEAAAGTGLPAGLPVFVALGDSQAAFLGCVGDRRSAVLVNVGTGAQVAAFTERVTYVPPLEVRPFPVAGNLLVMAGLSGGHAYALLERFFRAVGRDLLGVEADSSLLDRMNELAATVPAGAGGVRCEPFFVGTRADPARLASFEGLSPATLTPAHLIRAQLEGMARTLADGYHLLAATVGHGWSYLAAGGNGLRENALLAGLVAGTIALPLHFPRHREEAAVGAALSAGLGTGVFPDLETASALVGARPSSS